MPEKTNVSYSYLKRAFRAFFGVAVTIAGIVAEATSERALRGAYGTHTSNASNHSSANNLVIVTPGVESTPHAALVFDIGRLLTFPYSSTVHTGSTASELLSTIRKLVKTNGTFDELVIDAHGSPNALYLSEDGSASTLNLFYFLEEMQRHDGQKIANRIVFSSCDVATNLENGEWQLYRNEARNLGAQIVLSENTVMTGITSNIGRYIVFQPDGRIERDKLYVGYNPMTLLGDFLSAQDGLSSKWFDLAQKEIAAESRQNPPAVRPESFSHQKQSSPNLQQ